MADNDNSTQDSSGSQRKIFIIFFIISLLITAVVGVLIYRYFNRQSLFDFNFSSNQEKQGSPVATVETGEPENASTDTVTVPEVTPTEEEEFAGFGGNAGFPIPTGKVTTVPTVTPSATPTPVNKPTQSSTQPQNVSNYKKWKANDYKFGDIKGETHLVIVGDTLWEISEGKYGEGRVWKKIADANSVRYLWNGNPLIVPGTTLSLPK